MDIQMPVMNGYEATRQIRKFNNDVIIIAQTAYALAGDREKAIEAGCNDYITKPINKNELFAVGLIEKYSKNTTLHKMEVHKNNDDIFKGDLIVFFNPASGEDLVIAKD